MMNQILFENMLNRSGYKWKREEGAIPTGYIYTLSDDTTNVIKIYTKSPVNNNNDLQIMGWNDATDTMVQGQIIFVAKNDMNWEDKVLKSLKSIHGNLNAKKKCNVCGAILVQKYSKMGETFMGCPDWNNHQNKIIQPQVSKSNFIPSSYQKNIFKFLLDDNGNGMVEAVAGSGKTKTIEECAKLIPITKRALFLAFNVKIKEELEKRLAGFKNCEVLTLNGLGHRTISYNYNLCNVSPPRLLTGKMFTQQKTAVIMDELVRKGNNKEHKEYAALREYIRIIGNWDYYEMVQDISKFVPKFKFTLLDVTEKNVRELDDRYRILDIDEDEYDSYIPNITKVMKLVLEAIKNSDSYIDYDDQLYYPVVHNMSMKDKYDYVFVDESQDVNKCQIELIKKVLKETGRCIFVGDRNQSIYGFRGADADAIPNIVKEFNCITLPLSITYRCPVSHVEMARKLVPEIEARPDAPEGTIKHIKMQEMAAYIQKGDLIICRNNAPLVEVAFNLILRGIEEDNDDLKNVTIKGKNISSSLVRLISNLCDDRDIKDYDMADFKSDIKNWRDEQIDNLHRKGKSIGYTMEKYEILSVLISKCKSVEEIVEFLKSRFAGSDDNDGTYDSPIDLTTIHGAKGLEAKRVFFLYPELIPSPYVVHDWERVQERNCEYVALTRSKDVLYFVHQEEEDKKPFKNFNTE